jgi:hypothetical protein
MRNLAYYRGARKHPDGWIDPPLRPEASFWRVVCNNCLDLCVLDWCKLLGDKRGQHYWKNIVSDPSMFKGKLLGNAGVTETTWEKFMLEMREYRDKFVAHLDSERQMYIPNLDLAHKSVTFYHGYIVTIEAQPGDLSGLPATPDELARGYAESEDEAESIYRRV